MSKIKIRGHVSYQNIATGFWGIIGDDGKEWRPVNMPEQIKLEGRKVRVQAIEVDDISIFMWGHPIRIISFHTLNP
jgi:hypothetical protein